MSAFALVHARTQAQSVNLALGVVRAGLCPVNLPGMVFARHTHTHTHSGGVHTPAVNRVSHSRTTDPLSRCLFRSCFRAGEPKGSVVYLTSRQDIPCFIFPCQPDYQQDIQIMTDVGESAVRNPLEHSTFIYVLPAHTFPARLSIYSS